MSKKRDKKTQEEPRIFRQSFEEAGGSKRFPNLVEVGLVEVILTDEDCDKKDISVAFEYWRKLEPAFKEAMAKRKYSHIFKIRTSCVNHSSIGGNNMERYILTGDAYKQRE